MKRILILLFTLASFASYAQPQSLGELRGRSRTGSVKSVGVDSLSPNRNALLVTDSVLIAFMRQMKTQDSVTQNLINSTYVLWRNSLSNPVDNKVGTRDTVLQEVLSGGRLKVETDNPSMLDSIKRYDSLSVGWNELIYNEMSTQSGLANNTDINVTDIRNSIVDSVERKLDSIAKYTWLHLPTIDTRVTQANIYHEQIRDDADSTRARTTNIDNKIPSGLTVASNRLAVYSPDSIRVFATNGFGGSSGSTSLDAVDSTNLARAADSSFQRRNVQVTNTVTTSLDSNSQRRGVVILGGSITAAAGATTIFDSTITRVSMTVTNLNSLANSATAGRGSDSVTNYRKASDYRIGVTLTMANTAPANDRAAYVYISPLYNNNGTWETASQGTTTLPTLTQGTTTIAQPNNLRLLGVLSYTTQNMVLRDSWSLSEIFPVMPDGFKIIIINFTGAAISASSNQVTYTPIFKTQR